MAKPKVEAVLEVPVTYGDVSIGAETCRIGITVDRTKLTISSADRNLCGKLLTGTILARAGGAQAEQGSLPDMDADVSLAATFNVKGFGVKRKAITAGLTFAIASIDVEKLSQFAGRQGVFTVDEIADIPAKAKAKKEADDGE
jgi:hypothetical protein